MLIDVNTHTRIEERFILPVLLLSRSNGDIQELWVSIAGRDPQPAIWVEGRYAKQVLAAIDANTSQQS